MRLKNHNDMPITQKGVTLIELMVTIVIGMLIIAATLALYAGTFGANSFQLRTSQLNNELRSVMTQITRDLRRSGYTPNFTEYINSTPSISTTATCVTDAGTGGKAISITYELGNNNTPEVFEYQYTTIGGLGVIQSRTKTDGGTFSNWTSITDPSTIEILPNSGSNPLPGFCITPISQQIVRDGKSTTIINYEIIIRARLVKDNNTIRTIRETIRIRNDTIAAIP